MKVIALSGGRGVALIDDCDLPLVAGWKWGLSTSGYAYRVTAAGTGKQHPIFMHREILGTPSGMDTDHINRNKLDNRRANLRAVPQHINARNTAPSRVNTSGYKGIRWIARRNRWYAETTHLQQKVWLGSYRNLEDAVAAYERFNAKVMSDYEPGNRS